MNNPYTSNVPDDSRENADQVTDPLIGKAVGSRIASLFTEFPDDDTPDRFVDLIDQLDDREQDAPEASI